MKPPPFEYHAPRSVADAVELLGILDNAKLLAGGQSLMAMLNLRFVFPDHLVDLNRVEGLAYVAAEPGEIRIGAMTRQRTLEVSGAARQAAPILCDALHHVGHRQTRNRGTVGGSLSHLDPAAELPALALLHDASIRVAGPAGERMLAMAEFGADYMTPAIGPAELVTEIRLPTWSARHGHAFLEVSRRHGDFAVALSAVLLEADGGTVSRAAIVVGGVDKLPRRLPAAERALVGQRGDAGLFAAAAAHARSLHCVDDIHFTADHRRHLAASLTARALAVAFARAAAPSLQQAA